MADNNTPDPAEGEKTKGQPGSPLVYTAAPTTGSNWVRPWHAVLVVLIVAVAVTGIVLIAVFQLINPEGSPPAADPNANTIVAIATAAISALTSLTAAYFGIKVASEQAASSTATAAAALEVASKVSANSTLNGNPDLRDF